MQLHELVEHGREARGAGVHHALAGLVTQDALQLQANALLVRALVAALEHGHHRVEVALEVGGPGLAGNGGRVCFRGEHAPLLRRRHLPRLADYLALLPNGASDSGHSYPPVSWRAHGDARGRPLRPRHNACKVPTNPVGIAD